MRAIFVGLLLLGCGSEGAANQRLDSDAQVPVAADAATRSVRILMLGDSWTQGYPGTDGFRPLVAKLANPSGTWEYVGTSDSGVAPTNHHRGVNGWRVIDHLRELGIYGTKPGQLCADIFTVEIGVNDCVAAADFAALPKNYVAEVAGLHTACPNAVFLLTSPAKYNSVAATEARRVQFVAALPGLWLNLEQAGVRLVTVDLDILSQTAGDYTTARDPNHPSPQGYEKLAKVIAPGLVQAIGL